MNTFFSASLGVSVCALALLLVYRLCERRLDSSQWSLLFFTLSSAFLYLLGQVFAPVLLGSARGAWGLLPAGFSPSLRSPLREVAAAWRPGPLEIMTWVWLAGLVLCLLWNIAAIVRVQRRVRRESRPAGEAIQKALVRVSRAMDRNVLNEYASAGALPNEVRVMPGLPGPASVVVGPRAVLLDREDYDEETLDAIFRHELVHIHGNSVSGTRVIWTAFTCIFWFSPPVWLLRREARVREEYTCDREANLGRTQDERRAYAHAMADLAAGVRREWPGTAGMACGASTLRRRVEALFREEKPASRWRKRLFGALRFLLYVSAVLFSLSLFGGPARYTLTEENILHYVGQFRPYQGMHESALTRVDEVEDALLYRMETRSAPYGATAVYYEDIYDIYLAFSDSTAADEACASLSQRLTTLLGEAEAADGDRLNLTDDTLSRMLEQPPADGAFKRRVLGTWRGTTDDGAATITLARADAENGAVVALLWGEEIETQPLPFDIDVFIISTMLQNDSAPSGTE